MRLSHRAVVVACGLATLLAMGLSIRNGFVYDDVLAIVQNPRVTDPALWSTIPGSPYWLGALWRPVTILGFGLQWWIGGGSPWVFHVVLLVGYLGTGLALYALMRRLAINTIPALAATLLFLVHQVHVEVVANGVGQAEIWTALALLTATSIYLDARRRGVTIAALGALLALVVVAIMSKEQGFTAPLLLVGAEWLLLAGRRDRPAERIRLLIPVTAVTLLLLAVRTAVLGDVKGESVAMALRGLGLGGRVVTFLAVVPEYGRLLVWPVHLQADYSPPGIPVGGPLTSRHLAGIAVVIGVVALFFWCRRRAPVAAFGLWWAGVTLAPVSNLLSATGMVMAERALFLPSVGVAIALAVALRYLWNLDAAAATTGMGRSAIRWRAAWGGLIAVFIVGFTVRSAFRVGTWRSQRRFYTDLPINAPRAYRAWKGAGEYWEGAGDHPRAIAYLRHALALWPSDYEIHERLGQFLRADGQCAAAIPVLFAGVRLGPDVSSMRAKLIECLISERRWDDAERVANEALARGQSEFESERLRIARLRADAGGTSGSS
ncbi:MAG: tetratricopeptide repeat protein [Gemmatimonadales bacterium]